MNDILMLCAGYLLFMAAVYLFGWFDFEPDRTAAVARLALAAALIAVVKPRKAKP